MSREFAAAMKRSRQDDVEEIDTPTNEPKIKRIPRQKPKSLTIKVQEMEKYDWNPSMRFLLLILVLGTRRSKDDYEGTWAPSGWTAEEMVGWCDMSQWRLAHRVGLTEERTSKMLKQLEEDGFIEIEGWRDEETGKLHCRYRVIEEKVDVSQRKEHNRSAKRGPRYKEGTRKANKGSFSAKNQPTISARRKAIMEEDHE